MPFDALIALSALALAGAPAQATAPLPDLDPAAIVEPELAPAAAVSMEIRTDKGRKAISPLIYGTNFGDFTTARMKTLTFNRTGGNRLTAYNWETNASNAGSDYLNQNDGYLSDSNVPGAAFNDSIRTTLKAGANYVMTIPMIGHVAADKRGDGDVNKTPDFIDVRFNQSLPRKGAAFTTTPDLTDGKVYQDEYVAFLKSRFPGAFAGPVARISFMLDNEPDLWAYTHRRLRGSSNGDDGKKLTYAELFSLTKAYASAIKDVAPNALVYGPANYGWNGYVNLQDAPDARGRDFLDTYLAQMRNYETANGRRILDVLDVHWYPEARSADTGVRITEHDNSPGVVAARVQAPRSLYDPAYVENSWISQCCVSGGTIRLIPRLKGKIASKYPGTGLSVSEYNYGGGDHISGGVATADVLGIFGREGVFSANMWSLGTETFTYGGFDMYRNFDGAGAAFGDTSVRATTSDGVNTAVYAATDSKVPGRLTVVMINRSGSAVTTSARLYAGGTYTSAHVWRLEGANPAPQDKGAVTVTGNTLALTLPPLSVSTVLLQN